MIKFKKNLKECYESVLRIDFLKEFLEFFLGIPNCQS